MSYDTDYRPNSLKRFIGNEEIVESILKKLKKKKLKHSILFTGTRGCGKTTLAKIISKEIGAIKRSIIEMNVANTRGIDTVREVIENSKYKDIFGHKKVFIFDEAHKMTIDAQEALLKIVEDSPEHVYWIFCSTDPQKIKDTLRDRCLRYDLKPLGREDAKKLLKYVIKKEEIDIEDRTIKEIIKHGEGRPRLLLMNLYNCQGLSHKKAVALLENMVEGVKDEVINICRMIINPSGLDWGKIMKKVDNLVKEDNAESVRRMMFAYFSSVLKGAKDVNRVFYYTAILEVLDAPLLDGTQGKNGLIYLLGRIVTGVLGEEE